MKSNKFTKFLKEANLLKSPGSNSQKPSLKISDVDIIFIKISNNAENSMLTTLLNGSINSLHTISGRISPIKEKRGTFVNSGQKIEFTGFINAIEIISLLLYPDTEELTAIDTIINSNILPLLDKIEDKNNDVVNLIINEKEINPKFVNYILI
jgi:hypothetical protein